ncbi:hypothetical protein GCM10027359_13100 [Marilutibacter aestuarii]
MRKNSSTSGCSALAAKNCFIRGVCSGVLSALLDIGSLGWSWGGQGGPAAAIDCNGWVKPAREPPRGPLDFKTIVPVLSNNG